MLSINNVTKTFGNFIAVDNLSIEVPSHEMLGFLGGNGAGKTTTFRMILGLLEKDSGIIEYNNQAIK